MLNFRLRLLVSSLAFMHSAAWALQPSDQEFKAALDRVNSHYDARISALLEGFPELVALKEKALRDPSLSSALETAKTSWLPAVSKATHGLREAGQKYYVEAVQPKIEGNATLSTAAKAASSAKSALTSKIKMEIKSLNSRRNDDLRAIYSQNEIPLPTSLRGD